jgi:hypothetical protein
VSEDVLTKIVKERDKLRAENAELNAEIRQVNILLTFACVITHTMDGKPVPLLERVKKVIKQTTVKAYEKR